MLFCLHPTPLPVVRVPSSSSRFPGTPLPHFRTQLTAVESCSASTARYGPFERQRHSIVRNVHSEAGCISHLLLTSMLCLPHVHCASIGTIASAPLPWHHCFGTIALAPSLRLSFETQRILANMQYSFVNYFTPLNRLITLNRLVQVLSTPSVAS